ncbi:MAG TPA: hypothetical protein VLX61_08460 [Anaerolineales bacterium]|nr:hypothetical protein [Anaerolineales bacterium]
MKKVVAITVLSIFVLALTACGAAANPPQPSSSSGSTALNGSSSNLSTSTPMSGTSGGAYASNGSSSSSAPISGTPTSGLSALQLAAGMLKLAGTSNAVTSQEATQLLPLWQSLQQIEGATLPQGGPRPQGTPGAPQPNPTMMAMRQQAAVQIGVIENAMPPAQIQAITSMNLTGQDIFAAFQQAGITMGGPGRIGSNGTFTPPQRTPPVSGTPGAFRGGLGQGAGRMGMGTFLPPTVVTGIIQFLQKTAGS